MSTDAVTLLLALLTVASWAASATLVAAHLSGGVRERVHAVLAGQILPLGFLVAAVSMAGSLYLSEVADFVPCNLCWYQRIAMYPLALVLTLAALRRDPAVRPYGLALAGAGLVVSAWHNVIETFPDLHAGSCDPTNPCTIRWVEGLGFWTIPRMAFVAFALVFTALLIDHPLPEEP